MLLKKFSYISQKEGAHNVTQGNRGKHQIWSGGRRIRGEHGRDFIVFSMGKTRQGRGNSLGLASLNDTSGFWDTG